MRLWLWYKSYTSHMRFQFDARKSKRLRANPKRGIGFEDAQEIFSHPYYLDQRSDFPEQYRAIGWAEPTRQRPLFTVGLASKSPSRTWSGEWPGEENAVQSKPVRSEG